MTELNVLWEQLEGHHRLTKRVIAAFPNDALFSFKPVPAMRCFAEIAAEILQLEEIIVQGVALGTWKDWDANSRYLSLPDTASILQAFDEVRAQSTTLWPRLTPQRLDEVEFDPWMQRPSTIRSRLEYMRDNEIHHRGQGYVYLRLLGIEPPAFWER